MGKRKEGEGRGEKWVAGRQTWASSSEIGQPLVLSPLEKVGRRGKGSGVWLYIQTSSPSHTSCGEGQIIDSKKHALGWRNGPQSEERIPCRYFVHLEPPFEKLSYVSFSVRISAADLCGVFVLIPASYHVW